jgi:hypothetical protein
VREPSSAVSSTSAVGRTHGLPTPPPSVPLRALSKLPVNSPGPPTSHAAGGGQETHLGRRRRGDQTPYPGAAAESHHRAPLPPCASVGLNGSRQAPPPTAHPHGPGASWIMNAPRSGSPDRGANRTLD